MGEQRANRVLQLVVFAAVVLCGCGRDAQWADEAELRGGAESFRIDSGSSRPVLEWRSTSATSHGVEALALYPDGRLVRRRIDGRGSEEETAEARLTQGQVRDVVRVAVAGGLVEFDPASVRDLAFLQVSDAGTATLTIHLASYEGSPAGSGPPVSKTIIVRALWVAAARLPDIVELRAMIDVYDALTHAVTPVASERDPVP